MQVIRKVRVTTYNDEGEIVESSVISQESGRYGVDIPKNVWHGVECLEPSVLLECKAGPFVEHEVDGILETKPTKDIYLAGGCFWGTEHYFPNFFVILQRYLLITAMSPLS